MQKIFPCLQRHTILYIFIGLTFLSSIFIYLITKHKEPIKEESTYTNCNQKLHASAPIQPSSVLNDKNDIQLLHAQTNGLKEPFATNAAFDSLITFMVLRHELVELKDSRLYHLKSLKHSHPYLIPEAVDMVNEIAFRFQKKLQDKKLGNYCFFLTSLLRTVETQDKLSKRNGNATDHTAHYYGTTVDISYKHFYNLDTDSITPSWEVLQELTKTLIEMREDCKILAVRKRKQSCFHITVVVCKPDTAENKRRISF